MTSGNQAQASQTVSGVAHGMSSGSKLKLESRAADLKKLLLGQRQLAAGVNGRQLSSPSGPDPLTVKESSVVIKARATESSASGSTSSSLAARQDFSIDDIDALIAGLLPREKSPEGGSEAASVSASKAAPEVVEDIEVLAASDSNGNGGVSTDSKTTDESPTSLRAPTTVAQMTESLHLNTSPSSSLVSKAAQPSYLPAMAQPVPNTSTGRASLSSTNAGASAAQTVTALGTINDQNIADKAEQLVGTMESSQSRSTIMSDPASDTNNQQYETLSFTTANTHAHVGAPLSADEPSGRAACTNADQEAKDLQDWLFFTNYYDLSHRTQFLARRRRLAALEIERQKLLEEEKEEASLSVQRQFTPASLQAMSALSATVASLLSNPGPVVSDSPALSPSNLPNISPSRGPSFLPTSPSPTYRVENCTSLGREQTIADTDDTNTNGAAIITQYISSAKRGRGVNLAEEDDSAKRPQKVARRENATGRAVDAVSNPNKQTKTNGAKQADRQTADPKADVPKPNATQDSLKTPQSQNIPLQRSGDGIRSPSTERVNTLRRQSSSDRLGSADNRRTSTSLAETPGTARTANFARYSPPPQDFESRGRSQQRPNKADRFNRFDKRNAIDRYTSESNGRRQRDDGRRQYQQPRSIDVGQRGDTRFFMLKSFNECNVRRAMADGVWTTQLKNEAMLVAAFKKCRNVVFFFSVNKSRAFQGYARMESLPSANTPRPGWMDNIHWQTTEPFRVDWYNTTTTDFCHIAHLINNLNDHRTVIIGKDGQEIDNECGRRLMAEMDITAEGEEAGNAAGRGRAEQFRRSPSLASRVTGGRPLKREKGLDFMEAVR